jgi:predicted transcriptional regulator
MAELHEVHQRLEAALVRLDSAVRTRIESSAPQARVEELAEELERATADHARLQETTDAVAQRLDTTIERLRKILDE